MRKTRGMDGVRLLPHGDGFRMEVDLRDIILPLDEVRVLLRMEPEKEVRLALWEGVMAQNQTIFFAGYSIDQLDTVMTEWHDEGNMGRMVDLLLALPLQTTWKQFIKGVNAEIFGRNASGRKLEDSGSLR